MKTPQKKGREAEKRLAKELNARQQPNSGAVKQRRLKGDVVSDHCLYDEKTTLKKSYSVTLKDMRKIEKEALDMTKMPVLVINFNDMEKYAVLRLDDYKEIMRQCNLL